jgi:hypothetical protein
MDRSVRVRHAKHQTAGTIFILWIILNDFAIFLNNGVGELSLLSETESLKYQIDIEAFVKDFSHEIKQFVSKWMSQTQDTDTPKRGLSILNKL